MNAKAISERKVFAFYVSIRSLAGATAAIVKPKPAVHTPTPFKRAVCGAVVVTVSVVEPLPVTEAGLKLHVLSRGNPAHDAVEKLTVPLYPVWPVMVSVVMPLPPGLEIDIDGGHRSDRKISLDVNDGGRRSGTGIIIVAAEYCRDAVLAYRQRCLEQGGCLRRPESATLDTAAAVKATQGSVGLNGLVMGAAA